jgi:hypothetical protein
VGDKMAGQIGDRLSRKKTPHNVPQLDEDKLDVRAPQSGIVQLQRYIGNSGVRQLLGHEEESEGDESGAMDFGVPAYFTAAINHEADTPRYRGALSQFRAGHPSARLQLYRDHLSEAGPVVHHFDSNPLQAIRRMGRANRETREDLETAPVTDEFVTDIIAFFYPGFQVSEVNDQLRQLAAEMLYRAIEGSRMMDMVPRPPGNPGVGWLGLQAVQMAWRRGRDEGIYVAVRNTIAASYRSRFEMARHGI